MKKTPGSSEKKQEKQNPSSVYFAKKGTGKCDYKFKELEVGGI